MVRTKIQSIRGIFRDPLRNILILTLVQLCKCLYKELSVFYLVKEKFDIVHCKNGTTVVHVLLEVPLQKLEHQGEGLVRVHDVVKGH